MGGQPSSVSRLSKKINSIVPPGKKGLDTGFLIQSLDKRDTLYERAADKLLVPASVAKLFTTYTALKRLRPTSTFKTQVYVNGNIKDGLLVGDLYLKGGGDPSLVSERLWMLVNDLVRSGIKTINGNITADSSFFDGESKPGTRPKYLKDQAYNAPIGALSFNFNTTTIYVSPGDAVGASPTVYTDPENSYIDIANQATTGKGGSANSLQVSRTDFVKGDIGDTILLRGSIPLGSSELRFYRNIVNPALYTAHMFKAFWEQRGLKFTGRIVEGSTPDSARKILEFESLPLWQVVWGMNKFSNNFVADQILKKVAAEVWGPPGSLQKGIAAIEDTLDRIGIPAKSYQIKDGSGLTRETKVTARQIMKVLTALYNDFAIAPEALSSLGVAGEDGTLKKRLPSNTDERIIRAKTGSLDGVNSLAGFTTTRDGERVAFAFLLNDPKMLYGRMIPWIDQMTLAVGEFSRGKTDRGEGK